LSGRDVDNAILNIHNIEVPKEHKNDDTFSLQTCPRCDKKNPPGNKYCNLCGIVLEEEAAQRIIKQQMDIEMANEVMDTLIKDEEFRDILKRKLKTIKTK